MTDGIEDRPAVRWMCLVALIIAAIVFRIWAFPHRYYHTDMDEIVYLMGGTQVLEGLPPVYHYAFAGPETWTGLLYSAGLSARYMLSPTPEESAVHWKVRPFVAVNHAIFDIYNDPTTLRGIYVVLSMIISVIAVAAGFAYGRRRGGLAGGILLGGLMAMLPVIVMHSALAKPYSLAWSCVIVAAYLMNNRSICSAILLGLAISSRVDMLAIMPLLVLLELWPQRTSFRAFAKTTIKYLAIMILTIMVVAPWSWTNLLGNLRAIATVRAGPAVGDPLTRLQILRDIMWDNALGLPIVLFLTAWVLAFRNRNRWPWVGAAYATLLLLSILSSTGYGMRHQGPAFMSLLLMLPFAIGIVQAITRRWIICVVIFVMLALAGFQSGNAITRYRNSYVPDEATQWVNAHVPPGTIVYFSPTFNDPLPTPASADAIWDEVSSRQAAVKKFESGLTRLNLGQVQMLRALSEQNMVTERGLARRFYILGSRADQVGPRFDLRRYDHSVLFGLQKDPLPEFTRTGGVLIWRGDESPTDLKSEPAVKWVNDRGRGTYIFVSPEIAGKLMS